MCVISGEKNDNVNVEEKSGIVQVNSTWLVLSTYDDYVSRSILRLREPVFSSPLNLVSSCFISTTCGTRGRRF